MTCFRVGAQTVAVHARDLFREVNIIFITSTIVWAQVNSRDRCCKEQYCIGTWNVRSMNQRKFEVVKQETERVNINILGISELKRTGMGEFNSDDHYIYYCGQESLRRNRVAITVNKRVLNAVQFSSVAQLCPTLRPHESQHARPPCPSPTPRVYSNPCLLSQ